MALTDSQLVMLDTLIYAKGKYITEGSSVGDVISAMKSDLASGKSVGEASMSTDEWKSLISQIEKSPGLSSYKITNLNNDSSTGMRMACFVDEANPPADVNVIFRGTSGAQEWHDNGEGAYMADTPMQKLAADYINSLPEEYGNNLTVSGHSKGGNEAQYATIVTDRVGRCTSVDGEGFSKEFIEKYAAEIEANSAKIKSISASNDFVNCLMYPIAGTQIYVETEKQSPFKYYHKPAILLDGNGGLNRITEQSDLSKWISKYTIYLCDTLDEPERSMTVDGLIALLEEDEADESKLLTIFAADNALGHLDDFVISELIDYLSPIVGEEVAVYISAMLLPCAFVEMILRENEISEAVIQQIYAYAGQVIDRLDKIGGAAIEFGKHFVIAVDTFVSNIVSWTRNTFDTGYKYTNENTYIKINTESLRAYARRIELVSQRIKRLDERMDSLYLKVGLRDLKNLLAADLMTGYDWHLKNCINYLNETATDFDNVERNVSSLF